MAQNSVESCDRFSDLPDHILHDMFSYLGDNDIVRISTLSKRCRQLCFSSPHLCFLLKSCRSTCASKCKRFSSFLEKNFGLRNEMDMHSLRLNWNCKDCEYFDGSLVDGWISSAVKCNVQELDLKFTVFHEPITRGFVFPICIFTCQSLRVLKLDLSDGILDFPSLSLASLEVLSLKSITIDEEFLLGEWISTFCPALKKLTLDSVLMISYFSMNSPSLEDLTISMVNYEADECHLIISAGQLRTLSLDLRYHSYFDYDLIIDIEAPNLQTLKQTGYPDIEGNLGNFMHVNNAIIDVERYFIPADSAHSRLVKLFRSVRWARVLQVKIAVIEGLFREAHQPILFENLYHLDLEVAVIKDEQLPAISSFLMRSLNLKTLTIKSTPEQSCRQPWVVPEAIEFNELLPSKEPKKISKSKNPLHLQHLKEVEIELHRNGNEVGLIQYLLEWAKDLEKMTIFYSSPYFYKQLKLNLQNLNVASSKVEVFCFMQKEFEEAD